SQIAALQISVPPLPEQRRIAEILDAVDRAIESSQVLLAKRRISRVAFIQRALSRALSSPVACLGDLATSAVLGTTERGSTSPECLDLVKMGSLDWGSMTYGQVEAVDRSRVADIGTLLLRD